MTEPNLTTKADPGPSMGAKAASGASWTIVTSLMARALGLVGTLLITHYLDPDVLGNVSNAFILVITAHQFSQLGVTQYLVARPDAPRAVTWHVTLISLSAGAVAIFGIGLFGHHFSGLLSSPTLSRYLPGFAIAVYIERISIIPERLLVREMRFRTIGLWKTASELSYSVTSITGAILGFGGLALVAGNIVRAALYAVGVFRSTKLSEWLTPAPLSKNTFRSLLEFGIPLSVGMGFNGMSGRWDNLLISSMFGTTVVGEYNLAYNLAEVPANQIGYQIGDVLMPAFARMEAAPRREALVRSTGLLALVVFPLALGLGAVAPSLVATLLRAQWAGVAPMLSVLCLLAIFSPIGWTVQAYLQTLGSTRVIMVLEIGKLALLLSSMFVLGHLGGPLLACGAVGISFMGHAVASLWLVHRVDQVPFLPIVSRALRVILACVPMVAGILVVRSAMNHAGMTIPLVHLLVEVVVGAVAYVGSALLLARDSALEFLRLLGEVVRRRRK
jgi:PST family polysaccharide transporter